MKLYELTCLISPEISNEELKSLEEKLNSFIQDEKGILENKEPPSKKGLSFPIKKERNAYLFSLSFYLEPQEIENLKKKIKTEKSILRYLILSKKPIKKTPSSAHLRPSPKTTEEKTKKKVELKEIGKKLEEILNTD